MKGLNDVLLDGTNVLWMVSFGILLGTVVAIELRGRPALSTWALALAGVVGMVIGDVTAGLILGDGAGWTTWIRHPLQFVAAGALLLVIVLLARWREDRRVGVSTSVDTAAESADAAARLVPSAV